MSNKFGYAPHKSCKDAPRHDHDDDHDHDSRHNKYSHHDRDKKSRDCR